MIRIEKDVLLSFLQEVDGLFPVPLTRKVDLGEYANKLLSFATLVPAFENGVLSGLVAGYTDNLSEAGRAYIALVCVRSEFQRRGIARKLVEAFLDICRRKGLSAVHLYTDRSNANAICMYEAMGFVRIGDHLDSRSEDVHFSIRLDEPTLRRSESKAKRSESVLTTSIGSFSANAVLNGMRRAGRRVVGCDIHPGEWIANSSDVDRFYQIPPATAKDAYIESLLDICRREGVSSIAPLTDPEVDLLSAKGDVFQNEGIQVLISPKETISVCRDKAAFAEFVTGKDLGIARMIPTARVEEVAPYPYPLMCKPYDGRSSQGLRLVRNEAEWKTFVLKDARHDYVVQPFVKGRIVTVDVVRHPCSGQVVSIPRVELLRTPNGAGTSVCVFSDRQLSEACELLARDLGIVGCVNFEFLLDEKHDFHLLECNPRFSGGVAFSCGVGYDMIGNHLRCFEGDVGQIDALHEYQPRCIARRYAEWATSIEEVDFREKLDRWLKADFYENGEREV